MSRDSREVAGTRRGPVPRRLLGRRRHRAAGPEEDDVTNKNRQAAGGFRSIPVRALVAAAGGIGIGSAGAAAILHQPNPLPAVVASASSALVAIVWSDAVHAWVVARARRQQRRAADRHALRLLRTVVGIPGEKLSAAARTRLVECVVLAATDSVRDHDEPARATDPPPTHQPLLLRPTLAVPARRERGDGRKSRERAARTSPRQAPTVEERATSRAR
jgi:hypothetical protein